MADEAEGASDGKQAQRAIKWLIVLGVVFYSVSVGSVFLGFVAAGIVWYFMSKQDQDSTSSPESDPNTTNSAGTDSSLVYGPNDTVRAMVPDGMEGYKAEYALYATTRRPVTVEVERTSDPPSHIELLRRVAASLGLSEDDVPGNYHSEPPDTVLHEIRRQVRNDIDSGKVRMELPESRSSSHGEATVSIGKTLVEADEEGDGFRYSVSYDSRYFDWEEADSTPETDDDASV